MFEQLGRLLGLGGGGSSLMPTVGATANGLGTMGINSVTDPGAMSVANLAGGIPGAPGSGPGTGLGFNLGTGQLALSGLGSLGNLWTSFQAQDMAKKQFGLMSGLLNTNLTNSIRSYNTALADRARARGVAEGQSQEQVQDYVSRNSLSR
jgi:hypothetical protein